MTQDNFDTRAEDLEKWRGRLLEAADSLVCGDRDPWDVKMAARALRELGEGFVVFTPFKHRRKVTIFGSARIEENSALYRETRDLAGLLARRGFMVVTGAGPGIMHAGLAGAGREDSLGVMIEVPFEHGEARALIGEDRVVSMRYLFTRKLMLFKESHAFVAMPGGYGTLDEAFELLTLVQTGKGAPVPFVLLDEPGGNYWQGLLAWIGEQLVPRRLIDPEDLSLLYVTDDIEDACAHIEAFYANYHSVRLDGEDVVLRLLDPLEDDELAALNEKFAHLCASGSIVRCEPTEDEVRQRDALEMHRLRLRPVLRRNGLLRQLIDEVNALPARRGGSGTTSR